MTGGTIDPMAPRLCRIALVALMALSFASSAVANCFASETEASADMTCCPDGHQDCVPAMQAAQCCQTERPAESFVAVKPIPPTKLMPMLGVVFSARVVPQPVLLNHGVVSRLQSSASPPLFLLTSALRL